ncbi:MAG: NAD-dependent epimerase/dehydratase family protein [Nitrososphaerales archaeon]
MSSASGLPEPVLVTGGAGFIGRHLVNRLLEMGVATAVFDVPAARPQPGWKGRARLLAGDVGQAGDVAAAMKGIGTVFHCAAVVSDWAPQADYERITLGGSRNVFEEAVSNGTRVLLLSSFAVYGDQVVRAVLKEDLLPGKPLGMYGRYKQQQEQMALRYQRDQGMALTIVRPSKVYGPASSQWLHEVARNLLAGRPVLINGGNFNPALVYVENLVEILILAAARGQPTGRVYNGYDGTDVTWRRYCTDLARIVGAPPPRAMPGWLAHGIAMAAPPLWRILGKQTRPLMTGDSLTNLMTDYKVSMDRVCGELGFTPRISYEESLAKIAAYWAALRQ